MLNKDNYVPWSSRLLCYAMSKPNGKLLVNSIKNGPYARQMIHEPALGWILEEIHVTWAYLEKKQTRLRLYTKSLEEIIIQTVEKTSPINATTSELDQDGVKNITTASECSRLK
nr:hypothetical protein [Tanacetum cinerariifolium]